MIVQLDTVYTIVDTMYIRLRSMSKEG
jgi:hypothetical protein